MFAISEHLVESKDPYSLHNVSLVVVFFVAPNRVFTCAARTSLLDSIFDFDPAPGDLLKECFSGNIPFLQHRSPLFDFP